MFMAGYHDAKEGLDFRRDYETMRTLKQEMYEFGRFYAVSGGPTPKIKSMVQKSAIQHFRTIYSDSTIPR
jgi:hypothetical protein